MNGPVSDLRQELIAALTSRGDVSWSCSSRHITIRRAGQVLCKVGTASAHVPVEFPLPSGREEAVDATDFVGPASAEEADAADQWREARLSESAQIPVLLALFPAPNAQK